MKKILVISVMALAALTACQKEQKVGFESGSGVTLDLQIGQTATRYLSEGMDVAGGFDQVLHVGSGYFGRGDVLGLYIVNTNPQTNGEGGKYFLLENGAITPDVSGEQDEFRTKTYYFEDLKAKQMRFSAYYPILTYIDDPSALAVEVPTQTSGATGIVGEDGYVTAEENQRLDYEAADLLVATNSVVYDAAQGVQTLPMVFQHGMSKVFITLDDVEGIDAGNSMAANFAAAVVKVTAKAKGTANLIEPYTASTAEGTTTYTMSCVKATDDPSVAISPIAVRKPATGKKVYFVFLFPPQSFTAGDQLIEIVVANPKFVDADTTPNVAETITYKYAVPATGLSFAANTVYTYDFKVGMHRIELDQFTIAAWNTGAQVAVENPDPELE